MRLDTFFLADAATVEGGKLNVLGAGISRLTATALPWVQPSLALVARFLIEPDELSEPVDHVISIVLSHPNGAPLIPFQEIPVPARDDPAPLAGEELHRSMVLGLAGLVFPEAGLYGFELGLDGEIVYRMPLPVTLVQPEAAPASSPEL